MARFVNSIIMGITMLISIVNATSETNNTDIVINTIKECYGELFDFHYDVFVSNGGMVLQLKPREVRTTNFSVGSNDYRLDLCVGLAMGLRLIGAVDIGPHRDIDPAINDTHDGGIRIIPRDEFMRNIMGVLLGRAHDIYTTG